MRTTPVVTKVLCVIGTVAALCTPALADPVVGGLLGAGAGAAVGHSISGRDGALVGGALGAAAGYQIGRHYGQPRHHHVRYYRQRPVRYYHSPARLYSAPAYYAPRPAYYVSHPVGYRAHRHVHYHHDRYGRLVRVYSWY